MALMRGVADYAGGDVPDRKEKHKVVEQKRREKVRQGLGGIFDCCCLFLKIRPLRLPSRGHD